MDSKLKRSDLTLALLATALSGVAFYFGTDLLPPWWLIWVAALPVLWIAPRVSWWIAIIVAFLARTIAGLNSWSYHEHLQIPLWANMVMLLEPALVFTLAVMPFRAFMRRRQPWLAVLAYPVAIVACEYLFSLLAGTFGDTAYTQLDNVTVLQVAALAGIWGVGFAVLLFAPMIVAIAARPPGYPLARTHLTIAFVLIYAAVFGYGTWRMASTPAAQKSVRVGLISSATPQNVFPSSDEDAMRIMREYAKQVPILATQGAKIVVLPEMTAASYTIRFPAKLTPCFSRPQLPRTHRFSWACSTWSARQMRRRSLTTNRVSIQAFRLPTAHLP